ncbi:putative receptor-like protein kinase At4g00960 isoform X3 [Triticum dicoccoides]|uniref:putative receptor-like protein kinase At4g00960 isoform X3 n=1 Tax=Triticum dicoccoides TaxID=85692 RepID=UPI00188F1FE7|nr:putative receptor-like protein kinase At4g00960 isoform X3 [Triticum dicoccoides]
MKSEDRDSLLRKVPSGVGQVANIAQLAGVDVYGLITMIVEAARTVRRNRETCQLLARRVKMIGDLLQQLESTQLMQHTETRNPVEQLEETLRHTYMLIRSCQDGSYLYSWFMGGKQADQLHQVQNEIAFYLQLFPLVGFVDTSRTWARLLHKAQPLGTEDTMGELHAVHPSEHNNRTEALKEIHLEDPGIPPCAKSDEEQNTSAFLYGSRQAMNMEEIVNLIGVGKGAELPYFSFSQILAATDNLSLRNLLGNGVFGCTYKGKLPDGLDIAIKRHNTSSHQGLSEFQAEIEVIPNLRHKNIISLLGFCVQGKEKILVYEYMSNNSLADVISDETKRKLLNWSKCLQIIKGIADGLVYLHLHSQMCIVHRDLKPSNLLLDPEMNAKISDFGLAKKLAPDAIAEDIVCGTYGYADPEYVTTGKLSQKADVYSFGIVVLEIICGNNPWFYMVKAKKGSSPGSLPDHACKYLKRPRKLVDPLLRASKGERAQIAECVKVALLCVHCRAECRPAMSEVVAMLCSVGSGRSSPAYCCH